LFFSTSKFTRLLLLRILLFWVSIIEEAFLIVFVRICYIDFLSSSVKLLMS